MRRIELSVKTWLAGYTIAVLRKTVNDPIRANHRDRGTSKNILNDLQGAMGELVALQAIEETGWADKITHDLVSLKGPVDDVDIKAHHGETVKRLETKCLLMQPNKRLFLVNRVAHHRSIARNASEYVPILTKTHSKTALVGKTIPIGELENWRDYNFKYGDPAIGIPLTDFVPEYFDITFHEAEQEVSLGEWLQLNPIWANIVNAAPIILQAAEKNMPSDIQGLPFSETIDFFVSVLRKGGVEVLSDE